MIKNMRVKKLFWFWFSLGLNIFMMLFKSRV